MLECAVHPTPTVSELAFFRVLHDLDPNLPDTREAMWFARTFADLARRVLAGLDAQSGQDVFWPPLLGLPALLAYSPSGLENFSQRFMDNIPTGWHSYQAHLLCSLGLWLADGFSLTDPLANSYQVWIGKRGETNLNLYGDARKTPPPAPLTLLTSPPVTRWLSENPTRPTAAIGHYDVHGLSMLAMTRRQLAGLGIAQVDCAMSFEWTGDISKLWKRAVPRTILHENDYSTVLLLDCSIHSRKPEYTMKAVAKLASKPNTHLLVIDHHEDTFYLAPQLCEADVDVVLTDVYSCGLYSKRDNEVDELRLLGALGDKVPEALTLDIPGKMDRLAKANTRYHMQAVRFSPTPKVMKDAGIYPLQPLWEALADGRQIDEKLALELLGEAPQSAHPEPPPCIVAGSVLATAQTPGSVGRMWYGQLEALMERENVPYSMALRILDGRRANLLLLTHWKDVHMPPIREFIPDEYLARCLGHPSAVWVDLEIDSALQFFSEVAQGINSFTNTSANLQPIRDAWVKNIINPALNPPLPSIS